MMYTSRGPAALFLFLVWHGPPPPFSRPTSLLYAELSASTASGRSDRGAQPPGWPDWRSSGRSGGTGSQSGWSLPGGAESCRVRRAAGARMSGGDGGGACVRACVRCEMGGGQGGGGGLRSNSGKYAAAAAEARAAEHAGMGEPQAGCQLLSHADSRCRWGTSCPGSGPSTACRPGRCSGGTATQAGDGISSGQKADALGLGRRSSTRPPPPFAHSI